MKCPITHKVIIQEPGVYVLEAVNCLKKECAWWGDYYDKEGKKQGCCSIPAIALGLSDILKEMRRVS